MIPEVNPWKACILISVTKRRTVQEPVGGMDFSAFKENNQTSASLKSLELKARYAHSTVN
jgi:hypothetical protein